MKALLVSVAVVLGCICELVTAPKPLLVWNVTASAPIGFYRRSTVEVAHGDWVLVWAPLAAAELAAQRRYLPRNVPMVKRVAALAGDTVCRIGQTVRINGAVRALALRQDRQGRDLPVWEGCTRLSQTQIFVLTAPPTSFDSRYFGPVPTTNLIERIVPLWTF